MNLRRCTALALGLGAVCFLIRSAVWSAAYDTSAQLLVRSDLTALFDLFLCLCAAILVLLLFSHWPRGETAPPPYGAATPLRCGLRLAAALCSLAAGVLMLGEQAIWFAELIPFLLNVLLIVQGGLLVCLTLNRRTSSTLYASLLLLPLFISCYWLVAFYHQYGSSPSSETYLWPTLAGVLVALAWMYYTGFSYQKQTGRCFGVTALLTLLTLPPAMAAPISLGYRLFLLGQLAWFWAAALELSPGVPSGEAGEEAAEAPAEPASDTPSREENFHE